MMAHILPIVAGILAIAALLAVRVLEYRRSMASDDGPERRMHGILLSRQTNPLAGLTGSPALRAEVLSDEGETLTLELKSMPLYESLAPGTAGTLYYQGKTLIAFRPDGPASPRQNTEENKMEQKILLQHAVIWGLGARDVLVQGERILAVGADLAAGSDTSVVDLTGYTLLPGFFNAHVHFYGVHGPLPDDLIRRFVTGGVTTVRDMGMTSAEPWENYMAWLAQHQGPEYPTIIAGGKFLSGKNTYGTTHPSGVKVGYVIEETPEGAAQAVDEMLDGGARFIKTGLDYGMDPEHPLDYLADEVFQAICRRAKERGAPSCAHITKADNFVKAARLGLTECAHTCTNHLSDEDIAVAVECGMAVNSTLSIFDMVSSETGEQIMDDVIDNIGRIYRAGIPVGVGTDFMFENPPYQTPGIPIHELRLLHRAGLTVEEIIRAATIDTARICGVAKDTGSIEPGKLANIIAVRGKIDEQFSALEQPDFVMNRGQIIVPLP